MEMPRLIDEQWRVLNAVAAEKGATSEADLRGRTGIGHVDRILRELETFHPPLVEYRVDEKLGARVWIATEAADNLLDQR